MTAYWGRRGMTSFVARAAQIGSAGDPREIAWEAKPATIA
jgi:hypothetical protein